MGHRWFWAYVSKVLDNLSKLFPDFSWDKMKFRVSLDGMLYQNEWIYFESSNLHILFAEQYPIHLCKSGETWPLLLNARDRNSLRSKYLEHPIGFLERNVNPTLPEKCYWFVQHQNSIKIHSDESVYQII